MQNVLVAGGAGFIGTNLCRSLSSDFFVFSVDNLISGDVKNTEEMAKVLLALFNGIAFEKLMHPSKNLDDRKYWIQVRNMISSFLKPQ